MEFGRFFRRCLIFGFPALWTAVLFYLYRFWSYDDPYITFRYAQNFIGGGGFVYNLGERILSTTTPLYALLLGLGGHIWADIPGLAVVIGSLSIGVSALLLFELADHWGHPVAGWAGLLLLPTFGLLSATLSSETPLYIALALAVFYTYAMRQFTATGWLAALLILARPDGALLPIILVVHFLIWVRKPLPWMGLAVFLGVSLLAWGAIWVYYGSPIPVTLAAKQHQGLMAISQGFAQGLWTVLGWYRAQWFFRIECILAVLGLASLVIKKSAALLLVAWTLAYIASYSLLGVTRYFWYYAPLVPGFILLVGVGLETIYLWILKMGNSKILVLTVSSGIVLGLFFFQARHVYRQSFDKDDRIRLYTAAGEWMRENTSPASKVAALEVGMIGYYSQRQIVDFAGLIQPEVARQMKIDSTYDDTSIYAIQRYQPDYVAVYAFQDRILNFLNARGCKDVKTFSGPDFGNLNDFIVFQCND